MDGSARPDACRHGIEAEQPRQYRQHGNADSAIYDYEGERGSGLILRGAHHILRAGHGRGATNRKAARDDAHERHRHSHCAADQHGRGDPDRHDHDYQKQALPAEGGQGG